MSKASESRVHFTPLAFWRGAGGEAGLEDETILTVVLEGGLGNRMRVAAASAAMADRLHAPVRVLWMEQWGMRCRFDALFEPAALTDIGGHPFALRDATRLERLVLARPQRRNLYLPRLVQRMLFSDVIFSERVMPLRMEGFDFLAWAQAGGRRLMHAYRDFYRWPLSLLPQLFVPTPEITALIDERCEAFSAHSIGVHVRRTDNQESIDDSPLDLFFAEIDRHIGQYDDSSIYLATDDEPTKVAMRQRYGNRIITSPTQAERESTAGIIEGLVEMYALSRTNHIYGSAGSTFSEMAAAIGAKPFDVVRRDTSKPYESGLYLEQALTPPSPLGREQNGDSKWR